MTRKITGTGCIFLGLMYALSAGAQSSTEQDTKTSRKTVSQQHQKDKDKPKPGPARQIGNGAGDIGSGAARGAGDLAKGTAKSAANLATLHPIDAASSLGRGGAAAGKNVTVGVAKGTGKIGKGIGRAFKKIL